MPKATPLTRPVHHADRHLPLVSASWSTIIWNHTHKLLFKHHLQHDLHTVIMIFLPLGYTSLQHPHWNCSPPSPLWPPSTTWWAATLRMDNFLTDISPPLGWALLQSIIHKLMGQCTTSNALQLSGKLSSKHGIYKTSIFTMQSWSRRPQSTSGCCKSDFYKAQQDLYYKRSWSPTWIQTRASLDQE